MRRRSPALPALLLLGTLVTGCGSDGAAGPTFDVVARAPAAEATGLAVADDGSILAGERLTGRLLGIDPATGDVETAGSIGDLDTTLPQGGLLGLAVVPDAGTFVAYTRAGGTLRVAEIDGEELTTRWDGPAAADEANGGRLVALPGQGLAIGIGDLLDPALTPDPDAPNGKLLAIAADGTTTPLATGFNNPFALAAGPDGTVWIADNAPGRRPERLLRVVPGAPGADPPTPVADWEDTRVPAGIAVLTDGTLAICNYATGVLALVDPEDPGDASGTQLADDCRYAVVALPDGALAYATEDEIVVLAPT